MEFFPPLLAQDARTCFVSIFSGRRVEFGSPLRSRSALAGAVSAQAAGFRGFAPGGGGLSCLAQATLAREGPRLRTRLMREVTIMVMTMVMMIKTMTVVRISHRPPTPLFFLLMIGSSCQVFFFLAVACQYIVGACISLPAQCRRVSASFPFFSLFFSHLFFFSFFLPFLLLLLLLWGPAWVVPLFCALRPTKVAAHPHVPPGRERAAAFAPALPPCSSLPGSALSLSLSISLPLFLSLHSALSVNVMNSSKRG